MKYHILVAAVISMAVGCSDAEVVQELPLSLDFRSATNIAVENGGGEGNLYRTASGNVLASWIEPTAENEHALRFAKYDPRSDRWSRSGTIAHGTDWFVNWADFPSVVSANDGLLTAHWLVKNGAGTYAYDVFFSQSSDEGASWSQPQKLHDDDSETEHGFVSLIPVEHEGILAAWLDGSAFATGNNHMSLRSRVIHPDGRLGPESVVDSLVCECCQTSMAALKNGAGVLVYRNRSEDEIRDIYVARYDAGRWSEPLPVNNDGWQIAGCPVNGPAVSAWDEDVVVAWFTAANESPAVKVAFSSNGARSFDEPIRLDAGRPAGRVDVELLSDGSAVVVWIEEQGERNLAQVLVRRVSANGRLSRPELVAETTSARAAGFPRMARADSTLVFLWTDVGQGKGIATRKAEIHLHDEPASE